MEFDLMLNAYLYGKYTSFDTFQNMHHYIYNKVNNKEFDWLKYTYNRYINDISLKWTLNDLNRYCKKIEHIFAYPIRYGYLNKIKNYGIQHKNVRINLMYFRYLLNQDHMIKDIINLITITTIELW